MPLTRQDFQELADLRIAEAGVLLANGMWDGAYYLAGYAVECGLKACLMNHIVRTGVIFEDKKYAEKCWTHDLDSLLDLANLKSELEGEVVSDPYFGINWDAVTRWKETRRYSRTSEVEAKVLLDAIQDSTHGVVRWIRQRW